MNYSIPRSAGGVEQHGLRLPPGRPRPIERSRVWPAAKTNFQGATSKCQFFNLLKMASAPRVTERS
jgi:hypothetical protein